MKRVAENEILDLKELDLSKLRFDISDGAQKAHAVYHFFRGALDIDDQIAFQCECGNLGVLPSKKIEEGNSDSFFSKGKLLCVECGSYGIDLFAPSPLPPVVRNGLRELKKIFQKAIDDNYMTLCYYFYSSLASFQYRFHQVNAVCDHVYEIIARNILIARLDVDNIGQIKTDKIDLRTEEIILQLVLINHVFELAELPDILLTVLKISESEHFLIGDDGHSIWPVGLKIKFERTEDDQARRRIVTLRRMIHEKNYFKLSKLIRKAFNPEVRNAFSHSEYRIEEEGIVLTGYNDRFVKNQDLFEMYMGAYAIQDAIYNIMNHERQRFIAQGGYEESGWKIEPIVEKDSFAVRIVGSSPASKPTGRKRQERSDSPQK